jgi:hypothetical protein
MPTRYADRRIGVAYAHPVAGPGEVHGDRRSTPERRRRPRRELGNRYVALIMAVVIGAAGMAAAAAYSVAAGAVMWCLAAVFFAGSFFIERNP